MIVIKGVMVGEINQPERQLTDEENSTVTSMFSNGVEFIYYQGDEPIVEVIEEPIQE